MQFLKIICLLIFTTAAFADESVFDGLDNSLTPDDEREADEYIHQGMADRTEIELCSPEKREEHKDLCAQGNYARDEDSKNWLGINERKLEVMMPIVAGLYSNVLAMPGLDTISMKPGEDGKKEQKQDNCRIVAMVGEKANILFQTLQNASTQQTFQQTQPQARQVASFEALARTHRNQRTASQVQMGVFYGTAACYAAYMATGAAWDAKNIAKLGAAAVIGDFYRLKAKAHKERADLLDKLASQMPQAGDCNPHTRTTCFCAEETSFSHDPTNFQRYCVPPELVARNQNNDAYVCIDKNGNADATCACDASNSCIDHTFKTGALELGISPNIMKDPLAGLKPISKGFGTGNLNGAANRNRALANNMLKKYKPTEKRNLSDSQKKFAKDLVGLGIPAAVAAEMAALQTGRGGNLPASLASTPGDGSLAKKLGIKAPTREALNKRYQKGGRVATRSRGNDNPFGKFNKRSGNQGGVEIDGQYAQKATLAAEIHNNPGASIFQVISNRYQLSGWKQFPEAFQAVEPSEQQ